jgi:FkbH-like protein
MVTREQVILGFRLLLNRLPDEAGIDHFMSWASLPEFVQAVMSSPEFARRTDFDKQTREAAVSSGHAELQRKHKGARYLTPDELEVTVQPLRRVLLIGNCVFDSWATTTEASIIGTPVDRILLNHVSELPASPPQPFESYDFQMLQVPLRVVLSEWVYLRLSYADEAAHQRMFEESAARLAMCLENALAWSAHLPTFVMNYMGPQQNMLGRFMPRYDLRNPIHFIERINEALAGLIAGRANCFLLDADRVASVAGRRVMQDDSVCMHNHGGVLDDYDFGYDRERLELIGPVSEYYELGGPRFIEMMWLEAAAMFRSLKRVDQVKMVCVDLDDTLWRGVLAEGAQIDGSLVEGWPLGVIEALAYLKKRGVLLTIISKNSEERIRELWPQLIGPRLLLDDFAIRKINWRTKVDNMAEAIQEAGLLPSSVVFVDDNPVERAAIKEAFPEIRVLGAPHYYWKRILLWSAETQVTTITEESTQRTEMVQAQVKREFARSAMSREEFLLSLDLNVTLQAVRSVGNARFARAFELLNKTNQFNTTGKRWSHADCQRFFGDSGVWWVVDVSDRFTRYGLVGIAVLRETSIDQFAMSCRVIGLDVERAVMAALTSQHAESGRLCGVVHDSGVNVLSRDLFERCGWTFDGATWQSEGVAEIPAHVGLTVSDDVVASSEDGHV